MPEQLDNLKDKELLIRLDGKVDNIIKILEGIPKLEDKVNRVDAQNWVEDEQIATLKGEVEKLRSQQTFWSTLNSIGIAIGTILGVSTK